MKLPFFKPLKNLDGRAWWIVALSLGLFAAACYFVFRCNCYNKEGLTIIPRKDWGAAQMNVLTSDEKGVYDEQNNPGGIYHYKLPLKGNFSTIVIHHSALSPELGAQYIQQLHMGKQLFADIGYHFIIDQNGRVFEGRDIGIRGAHVKGNNTGTIGVVLLGNFEETDPSGCQMETLSKLLRHLGNAYAVKNLTTHYCYNPNGTVCPGKNLISQMGQLAAVTNMHYLHD